MLFSCPTKINNFTLSPTNEVENNNNNNNNNNDNNNNNLT